MSRSLGSGHGAIQGHVPNQISPRARGKGKRILRWTQGESLNQWGGVVFVDLFPVDFRLLRSGHDCTYVEADKRE